MKKRTCLLLLLPALLISLFVPVRADDDTDTARMAIQSGEIAPLGELFSRLAKDAPGKVLKVELEHEGKSAPHPWIYEVKVLTPGGRVLKLEYDARDLSLLKLKGKGEQHHGRPHD